MKESSSGSEGIWTSFRLPADGGRGNRLGLERARRRRRIERKTDAIALFGPILANARREMLCVAHLDADRLLIGIRLRYSAHASGIDFPLRTIVADALALGTNGLILAHNHPSGDPQPSIADLAATRTLLGVARPLGLRLHDHLVFAGRRCVSLREAGLL